MTHFFDRNPFWARLLFAVVLVLAATFAEAQGAPGQSNYPATVSPASGAPSANCPATNVFYLNNSNGNLYTCPTPGSPYVLAAAPSISDSGTGTVTIGGPGIGGGVLTLQGSTSGSGSIQCNPLTTCGSLVTAKPFSITGASITLTGHLNQSAANQWAGSCAMSAATTCTFSIAATFASYLSFVSQDHASVGSIAANTCGASLSGTTVTITCVTANSLTWDAVLIGNPS